MNVIAAPIRYAFRKAGAEVVYHKLVAPYFAQTRPKLALTGITALNGAMIGGGVYFNYLWRDITNNLAARDLTAVTHNMESFFGFACAVAGVNIARTYITQKLKLSWGNWAKEEAVKIWLAPENRHRLVTKDAGVEPEQRIPNDIASLVNTSEPLTIGLASNVANAGAFSFVLFNLSPMLFAGVSTLSAVGTWCLYRGGKSLVPLNHENTTAQNTYRNALVDAKVHRQSIALWGGEEATEKVISERLQVINTVGQKLIRTNTFLGGIRAIYDNISFIAPLAIIAPAYFRPASTMGVGDASLSNNASFNLRSSLDWYNNNQGTIVEWGACTKRLATFLNDCSSEVAATGKTPSYQVEDKLGLSVTDLILVKPKNGTPSSTLCDNVSFELKEGDRLGVTGPSGCGKSSLFRTLAGINPYEDGQIIYSGVSKNNGDVIFVPQDPYIPDTTLQQILTFPKTGDIFSKAAMGAALEKVGLHHIIPYLNIKELTGSEMGLSGGERQRLNFARLLLHKPRIIGLDEVTSSLPAHDGVQLYQTLFEELPDSIIISIAHRTELLPLHNVVATIAPEKLSLNRHEPDREKSILVQTAAGAVVPVSKPLQL